MDNKVTVQQILQFANLLLYLGISAIESKATDEGKTVDEILLEADKEWNQAQIESEDLLKQGHNND